MKRRDDRPRPARCQGGFPGSRVYPGKIPVATGKVAGAPAGGLASPRRTRPAARPAAERGAARREAPRRHL